MLTKNRGYSLIELMLALLLGSVLLSMVIGLYVTGVSSGAKSLKYSRLRTDLQSIMLIMETDIRRAGYGGSDFLVGSGDTKMVDTFTSDTLKCIVYSYNHDSATAITDTNRMGFKFLPAENEIKFGSGVDPLAAHCDSTGYWEGLSDNNFITITDLTFTESVVSSASASIRSVEIHLSGELAADSDYKYAINTTVQVRNLEL
ncbi:putative type IV pilus assembly protein PilW [Psychromonas ingrahamii 37]|uniref:Putative type IV pilus assembly protein PilW n=1 Tax=Psychromonas ingrahamii (strain DSM 17664 / CCUG 51855 / 37) TaxID=357804 RepID=A1SSR8_PSYIN|nr:prepilin-type N-terminal cleavage/methylation domain-containing protein [Psychromonas ingrahamii]ABM02533.1 putative type IV pilus assembly protein PilW [Psychromonas ingrahamii 37]